MATVKSTVDISTSPVYTKIPVDGKLDSAYRYVELHRPYYICRQENTLSSTQITLFWHLLREDWIFRTIDVVSYRFGALYFSLVEFYYNFVYKDGSSISLSLLLCTLSVLVDLSVTVSKVVVLHFF